MDRRFAGALAIGALLTGAVAPLDAQGTERWAEPVRAERVDPKRMENPDVVARPGPLDGRVVGAWDLWVPGGVWYRQDGRTVYRMYTPGAAMNRLTVAADGSYRWAGRSGRLVEIRPWFAEAGQRFYAVSLDGSNRYMARFDEAQGKLLLFFWGVGGHAATGTRLGRPSPAPGSGAAAPRPAAAAWKRGDRVQVNWKGTWYAASIVAVGEGRYRVHYEGWDSSWDEWVEPERIRRP